MRTSSVLRVFRDMLACILSEASGVMEIMPRDVSMGSSERNEFLYVVIPWFEFIAIIKLLFFFVYTVMADTIEKRNKDAHS